MKRNSIRTPVKKNRTLILCPLFLLSGINARADVVTMKDGRQLVGFVESGTQASIRVSRGGTSQEIQIDQIQSIRFDTQGGGAAGQSVPSAMARNTAPVLAEPQLLGVVYARDLSGNLVLLERLMATDRGRGVYEIPGAHSRVRLSGNRQPMFIVRLANGIDPTKFNLFALEVRNSSRRTKSDPQSKTAQVAVRLNVIGIGQSSYGLTPARDLTDGEYALSESTSNDAYCFGLDPDGAAPAGNTVLPPVTGANAYRGIPPGPRPTVLRSDSPEESTPGYGSGITPGESPTDAIIADARLADASFSADLPNFFTQRSTTRYMRARSADQWRVVDKITADFTLVNGQEDFRNIRINGRQADRPEGSGSWSTGEFQSTLTTILSPITAAVFVLAGESLVGNRIAWVFDYRVEQAHSNWTVKTGTRSYKPAYNGQVWVDKQSHRVLRLEMKAIGIPSGFGLDGIETSLEYGFVSIDGVSSLLPVHSTSLSCETVTQTCGLNETEFQSYRKY